MSEYKIEAEGAAGRSQTLRSVSMKRSHENFSLKDMSAETAKSFCRVCGMPVDKDGTIEEPTAVDYKHVFESAMTKKLMAEIFKMGASS